MRHQQGGVVVVLAASCVLLLMTAQMAEAWGAEGHEAIAQVASTRLSTKASKALQHYLASRTLEQIAPLPDDYCHTSEGRWSEPLHYCNLPRNATSWSMRYCADPPGCVVLAISNYTDRLRKEGSNGPVCDYTEGVEPCPLEFLVHFVGDVHQPLHVGYQYDEGGNTVKVNWFGKYTNLHEVWDTWMIRKFEAEETLLSTDLINLINQEPSLVKQYMAVTDPNVWANESFQYVRTDVYNFTSSDGAARKDPDLGTWYYDHNMPIVKQRLIAAAVRLALLLNTLFA